MTTDDRLLSAVWQNDNLWATFNERCTPKGDTVSRACERLVEVSTPEPPQVLENRQLQSSSGADLYYSAATLSGNGDVFFGFTASSSTLNPTAAVFGALGGDFSSPGVIGLF